MRSEFEKWFKTTKIYKDALNLELLLTYQSEVASDPLEKGTSVGINGNLEFYLWSEAESAWQTWNHRQTEVDEDQAKLDASEKTRSTLYQENIDLRAKNDDLQKRVDDALKLIPSIKAENDLWGCDQVERQIELLEQALKGGGE